jgi:hypothetical protein
LQVEWYDAGAATYPETYAYGPTSTSAAGGASYGTFEDEPPLLEGAYAVQGLANGLLIHGIFLAVSGYLHLSGEQRFDTHRTQLEKDKSVR